jgi:hypothetical protein
LLPRSTHRVRRASSDQCSCGMPRSHRVRDLRRKGVR